MPDFSSVTIESPFVRSAVGFPIAETSDGNGVLFRCAATQRDFVATYAAIQAEADLKAAAAVQIAAAEAAAAAAAKTPEVK